MEKFRMDNTEGYTQEQLDELNRRMNVEIESHSSTGEDVENKDFLHCLVEQVQADYDLEILLDEVR